MMNKSQASPADKRARSRRTRLMTLAIVSAIVVVAVCFSVFSLSGAIPFVDSPSPSHGVAAASRHHVTRSSLRLWCPSQIGLSDHQSYGDQQFAASQGDLTSLTSLAAIGSVFNSTISDLSGNSISSLSEGKSAGDHGNASASHFVDTSLLQDVEGTGLAGTTASWASRGDVAGLASSSCVSSALHESFLVPSTQAGNAHQLVVANDSSKATVVSVTVWGTKQSGALDSRVASQLTVGAHAQASFNLSAAAPNQAALYVRMVSSVTPVYAVVKSELSHGLSSHGVDYEVPLESTVSSRSSASSPQVIAGLNPRQPTQVQLFSQSARLVRMWWLTDRGATNPSTISVDAQRVAVHNCGQAPAHARALVIDDPHVFATAEQTSNGNSDQQDFASISSSRAEASSAIALPSQLQASIIIANPMNQSAHVHLSALQADGTSAGDRDVTVPAQSTVAVSPTTIAKTPLAIVCQQSHSSHVHWALSLSSPTLTSKNVAGISVLTPTSLMPHIMQILVTRTPLSSLGR